VIVPLSGYLSDRTNRDISGEPAYGAAVERAGGTKRLVPGLAVAGAGLYTGSANVSINKWLYRA
jgi:hypothetical protein